MKLNFEEIYNKTFQETELVEIRRDLHRNPDPGLKEFRTQAKICEYLDNWGVSYKKIAGTGVIADFKGKYPGKNIGLRADIDALPVTEQNDFEFKSQVEGMMHACGHDIHTTILLGAAKALASLKGEFAGFIRLIFQPGEEMYGGARYMIKDGCLENPHLDHVFGLHVHPQFPVGVIGLKYDTVCAATNAFDITIHGKSSHAAMPENGIDPIVMAANMIVAAQTVVSRNTSAQDSALITFGNIHGGSVRNQVPDSVSCQGTIRTLTPQVRQKTIDRFKAVLTGMASSFGGTVDISIPSGYDPLIVDNDTVDKVRAIASELIGDENIIMEKEAQMYGEDFAYYANEVPSVFYHLGCKQTEGETERLHNSRFNPSEDCIPVGVKLQLAVALTMASE